LRPGIDFGTTNSSIARFDGNSLHRLELDPANDNANILPSLLYIDRDHSAVVGTAAAIEYLRRETGRAVSWEKRRVGEIDVVNAGISYVQTVHIMVDTAAQGRLLQYVKTALRDPTYEGTQVFGRFYTVDELISILFRWLKTRADEEFGEKSESVVIGRPVRFSDDAAVTGRAEEMLYKAARLAGFDKISFELEPIGAAAFYHRSAERRQRALIFDFGGGTLDLTVAELGGKTTPRILATHGVLVGGDDLDKRMMQSLYKYFGGAAAPGGKPPVPEYVLELLDNWQTMPILSRPDYLRLIEDLRARSGNPRSIAALRTLVTRNLGFKLFREIEQAKKTLSDKWITPLGFTHDEIDIHESITRKQFEGMIVQEIDRVEKGIGQVMADAGVTSSDVEIVLRTGGTSAVPVFGSLLERLFGEDKIRDLDLLTSVVGGLAIVAEEGGGSTPPYELRYPLRLDTLGPIQATSNRPYVWYEFRVGAQCYIDHPYALRRLPAALSGLPAIATAQADKSATGSPFLQFQLPRAARVFVAYDAAVKGLPEWLRSFEHHELKILVDQWGTDRDFRVLSRKFGPGHVALGANSGPGQSESVFMNYLVIVQFEM
jgi:hypothetical chaperone protein